VHAGGDTAVGAVDLPIQREAGTGLPVIWGQSLKGALRSHARAAWGSDDQRIVQLFGDPPPSGPDSEVRPGGLSVGDAYLAAFPVPTLRETFAWATSPLVLGRLRRRAGLVDGADLAAPPKIPEAAGDTCLVAGDGWVGERTVLGPYVLRGERDDATAAWARWLAATALPTGDDFTFFRTKLGRDLVVVGDAVLPALSRECAEVTPRVQLRDDSKTVRHGPFHTEYLPTETVLVALLETGTSAQLAELDRLLSGRVLRVGGDESIGKGLLWCRLASIPQQDARGGADEPTEA